MSCFGKKETDEDRAMKERNKRIEKQIRDDKQKYKATHRLLLLGESLSHPVTEAVTPSHSASHYLNECTRFNQPNGIFYEITDKYN